MPGFQWDNRYDLGVDAMNAEHKILIETMNHLEALADKKATKPVVAAALTDLARYTVQHFTSEEAYMAKVGFPGLATHKVVHQSLLDKFGGFAKSFEAGNGALPEGFIAFLHFWLRAHICGIDKKYADHAHTRAA